MTDTDPGYPLDEWERGSFLGKDCPQAPHRPPEGPNEDVAQCPLCLGLSYALRPEGETFGNHLKDCSLPLRHGGFCVGGGSGHPQAPHVRGWWKGWPDID